MRQHDDRFATPRTADASAEAASGDNLRSRLLQRRAADRYRNERQSPASGGGALAVAMAKRGVAETSSTGLPHADAIQRSFGRFDVGGINAHIGGAAGRAAENMGARAFASGGDVAFDGAPDLHTAAHEAAHVVQQQSGVHCKANDESEASGDAALESHADDVADKVVAGQSAEALLEDQSAAAPREGVQQKKITIGKKQIDTAKMSPAELRKLAVDLKKEQNEAAATELAMAILDDEAEVAQSETPDDERSRALRDVVNLLMRSPICPRETIGEDDPDRGNKNEVNYALGELAGAKAIDAPLADNDPAIAATIVHIQTKMGGGGGSYGEKCKERVPEVVQQANAKCYDITDKEVRRALQMLATGQAGLGSSTLIGERAKGGGLRGMGFDDA